MDESKRDKFKRLAKHRAQHAVDRIAQLGRLANRQTYEFTEEDVERLRGVIQAQLDRTVGDLSRALSGRGVPLEVSLDDDDLLV